MLKRKRPLTITLLSIYLQISFAIAIACILVPPTDDGILWVLRNSPILFMPPTPFGVIAYRILIVTFLLILGTIGVGLWRLKPWGRNGILCALYLGIAVDTTQTIVDIHAHSHDWFYIAIPGAAILATFVVLVIYFRRPLIRSLFAADTGSKTINLSPSK
jgi:hypothetical protein